MYTREPVPSASNTVGGSGRHADFGNVRIEVGYRRGLVAVSIERPAGGDCAVGFHHGGDAVADDDHLSLAVEVRVCCGGSRRTPGHRWCRPPHRMGCRWCVQRGSCCPSPSRSLIADEPDFDVVEVAACPGRTLEALRSAAALKDGVSHHDLDRAVTLEVREGRRVAAAVDVLVAHPQHGAVDVQRADVARNGRRSLPSGDGGGVEPRDGRCRRPAVVHRRRVVRRRRVRCSHAQTGSRSRRSRSVDAAQRGVAYR